MSLQVRFITILDKYSISDTTLVISSSSKNSRLESILKGLLQPTVSSNDLSRLSFVFSCFNQLIRSSLEEHIREKDESLLEDIALDQFIECTINKHGKGKGGINGRFDEEAINNWTNSFAFHALAASTLHEIYSIETDNNFMDAHVECSPNRQLLDDNDLSIIIKKLRPENLFTMAHVECGRIQSDLVIHDDIISNITSLHEFGEQALSLFIHERIIQQQVPVDALLKTITFLKLSQADSYVSISSHRNKSSSSVASNIEDYNTLVKFADEEIRRTIIIVEQRQLRPMSDFFAHEYSLVALSLCDNSNVYLLSQQNKAKLIDFLYKICPSSFYSSCPVSTAASAVVIDGGSLLETKPESHFQTIREYAI
ncbi:unnamed protein product [Rotaria sp. Silwood1]|nr:unnamed protein product [Rotaria sp. Silwood1]